MLIQPGQIMASAKKRGIKSPCLLDIDPQAIFELDVTRAASYDPSVSELLKNLVPQPWDGEAQEAYDFTTNAGAVFLGDVGSPNAWFESTGAMQIQLSGPTPTFFNSLHRTDITQEFSFVCLWYNPAAVINGQMILLGTSALTSEHGFNFRVEIGNTRYSFRQYNGASQANTYMNGPLNKLDAWNLVIFSFSRVENPERVRIWVNSRTMLEKNLTPFNASTGDPVKTLGLTSVQGSNRFKAGQGFRYAAALGGYMTEERANAIIDYLENQHQIIYV